MRVILINKRRLGVSIIIIGLMLTMFGTQKFFRDRINYTSLMQNNINSLKEYVITKGEATYSLPSEWNTSERSFGGEEIIYHNDFQSKDLKIHGFVEMWNLREDITDFLKKSEEISKAENKILDYKLEKIKINNEEWYLVEYTVKNNYGSKYRSNEYFKKNKDKLIRFSFFVLEENFKENMPTLFKTIIQTFKHNLNQ
ncbi:hypothetical protein KQI86_17950 [Clostridium sp. MSJ-11]|uniref:Membrane-associated protein n=1 Tax=Clostridium mobile TaxID=2841512 RepID=A0ABS6EP90_9CLOT|nr:hypothetical protein [Clostridium mobile]MBU5486205.1 hypothetical protein [Clostridium mobile]